MTSKEADLDAGNTRGLAPQKNARDTNDGSILHTR
jgi:hypothetical protein